MFCDAKCLRTVLALRYLFLAMQVGKSASIGKERLKNFVVECLLSLDIM